MFDPTAIRTRRVYVGGALPQWRETSRAVARIWFDAGMKAGCFKGDSPVY